MISWVGWIGDDVFEISFHGCEAKYFVSPLKQVAEHNRWEEVKEGDKVMLCGQYVVVVEQCEDHGIYAGGQGQAPIIECIVNWLKITGVEAVQTSRRGMNRRREAPAMRSVFR